MNRTVFILLAFLLFCNMMLQAEPVSESRAREIAMRVLAAQPATKAAAGDVKLIWNGEDAATKAAAQPAFYVFGSDRGGFVIVAGDDKVPPVLAISETNEFMVEGMPENVKWWMERMKYYVRRAAPDPEAKEQWAMFAETKSGRVEPASSVTDKVERLTPEWSQGNNDLAVFGRQVYNAKCPKIGNDFTLTGCCPTAIGEVLTYQSGIYGASMPTYATGTVGGYPIPEEEVEAGFVAPAAYELGTVYDWENLRTLTNKAAIKAVVERGSEADIALLNNLAQLLADVGAMAEASYSTEGTAAYISTASSSMGNHMGYNKAAIAALPADYSPRQWVQKLKDEINARPVLYYGQAVNGSAHAFVFDGYGNYSGHDVFHVNFGWNGSCNGYYYHYNLDSSGDPDYDFSYNCSALFDFYPTESSSPIYNLQYSDDFLPGLAYESPFRDDDYFVISYCVYNAGSIDYDGILQAKLLDKDDRVKGSFEIYKDEEWSDSCDLLLEFSAADYLMIRLTGSPEISFGDKIALYCSTDAGMTVFAPIKERKNGTVVNYLPVMPAAFIKTNSGEYSVGDYFQLELVNYDYAYAGTVWTITKEGDAPVNVNQAEFEYRLSSAGEYKIEAAVAPTVGGDIIETITTYITVSE